MGRTYRCWDLAPVDLLFLVLLFFFGFCLLIAVVLPPAPFKFLLLNVYLSESPKQYFVLCVELTGRRRKFGPEFNCES